MEPGICFVGGTKVVFAGGSSPTITAPVSNPRIDLLTIDNTGTLAIVTGTENASPVVPTYPGGTMVLAEIYNVVGETSILDLAYQTSGQGYIQNDVRPFLGGSINPAAIPYSYIPATNNTYDLGSPTFAWRNIYTGALYAGGVQVGGNVQAPFTALTNVTQNDVLGVFQGAVTKGTLPFASSVVAFTANVPSRYKIIAMTPSPQQPLYNQGIATNFVALWRDTSSNQYFVRAGYISNGAVSWGTAVQLVSTTDSVSDIVGLDATHFICTYSNSGSTLNTCAFTLSGTNNLTITKGSEATVAATSNGNNYNLIGYDATHFIVVFSAAARAGAVAGSISGTTITLGSVTSMGSSGNFTNIMSVLAMGGSWGIVVGQANTVFIAMTVSGTTITMGTQVANSLWGAALHSL